MSNSDAMCRTLVPGNICQQDFSRGLVWWNEAQHRYLTPQPDFAQSFVGIQSDGKDTDPLVHIVSGTTLGNPNPTEVRDHTFSDCTPSIRAGSTPGLQPATLASCKLNFRFRKPNSDWQHDSPGKAGMTLSAACFQTWIQAWRMTRAVSLIQLRLADWYRCRILCPQTPIMTRTDGLVNQTAGPMPFRLEE